MTTETHRRLRDTLRSCRAIGLYTAGLDLATYEHAAIVRDAVERRLGIIGEALNRAVALEPTLAEQLSELRQIVGLRNRVIHAYDEVTLKLSGTWCSTGSHPLKRASRRAFLSAVRLNCCQLMLN
jgi:uncharacterized protein with HEPN domain